MAVKEAKKLELLPRLTANEKRIFSALSNYGASTVLEIAERGNLSKGRVPAMLDRLIERGLVSPLQSDREEDLRYVAIFPVTRFVSIIDRLINSLEARKSELKATTQVVNNFTENAIKNVREASAGERQKRTDHSEEDIKDLEMAMDASFSGILASVEMDLKDLGRIAQTSNEFLAESSVRSDETCANIIRSLEPLSKKFSRLLSEAQESVRNKMETTVDARVSNVIDFETNANKAFDEVQDAFSKSQDAFEDIIFTVLDSGIEDLEKVTRPINDQIEQAINSLKEAIQEASNNFQTEILRVLTEQKRPMISCIEGLRPKTAKIANESTQKLNESLDTQFQELARLMETHTSIFGDAIEQLTLEFNGKVNTLLEQTKGNIAGAKVELEGLSSKYEQSAENNQEEKTNLTHRTANKTREVLNEMMELFIIILNHSVAQYQMDLSDLVARLETDFLYAVENHGAGVQNLVSFINMSLTEPINTLMANLEQLQDRIENDESAFLEKFDKVLTGDLMRISKGFDNETIKKEENFEKDIDRLIDKFDKEIDSNHDLLKNRLNSSQKRLQAIFKDFSNTHDKELKNTSKEVANLTRKLERWRGESVNLLTQQVNNKVDESMEVLSNEIDEIIDKIQSSEQVSEREIVNVVQQSYNDISKSFKGFGDNINNLLRKSLDEIGNTLKKDSLTINNRLVQFKKVQDKLIDETKRPSIKLIDEISDDYKDLYEKLIRRIERFFSEELESFNRNRREVGKSLENAVNRRGSRTSKEIESLKEVFEKARENYVKKTKDSFEDIEKTIARDVASLLNQEKNTRTTITNLTEKVVSDLANGVNSTAEVLRTNLWEGSEKIFGQAAAEINKQEIELNALDEKLKNDLIANNNELARLISNQIRTFEQKLSVLQESQIGNVYEFKNKFTLAIQENLENKLATLSQSNNELKQFNENVATELMNIIETDINRSVQELETKTSGIEGAIFSTVGNITAEAARKTEGVVVIGEQAVLGIEERYTESLESIRQNLTDEVITRIENESRRIEEYKIGFRDIGRNHLRTYGQAISNLNESLKQDLKEAEKAALKTISTCESFSCRFLKELDVEVNAMGDRVGLSTERLTKELLDGFNRVLQKVKREVALFARKQFVLSNRSNEEIAEVFLKSVDDLEEVMLKQIESFTKRTISSIDRNNNLSVVINDHIKEMTDSFKEINE